MSDNANMPKIAITIRAGDIRNQAEPEAPPLRFVRWRLAAPDASEEHDAATTESCR